MGRYKVVGTVWDKHCMMGLRLVDLQALTAKSSKIVADCTEQQCYSLYMAGGFTNAVIEGNGVRMLDGNLFDLPKYSVEGKAIGNSDLVLVTRAVRDNDMVYIVIDNDMLLHIKSKQDIQEWFQKYTW